MRLIVFALLVLVGTVLMITGCVSSPAGNTTNITNASDNGTIAPPVCSGAVCGSDGKTYPSDCEAAKANTTLAHIGACVLLQNCTDSDGGLRPEIRGTAESGDEVRQDFCVNASEAIEYICEGSAIANLTIPCGEGKACESGACVLMQNATENNTPQQNSTPPVSSGCVGNGFTDIFQRGSVTFNGTTYSDICVEFKTVKDYFCQGGSLKSENHQCDPGYGCVDGACVKQLPICTDTDDGNDTSKRGTAVVTKGLAKIFDKTDECLDAGTVTEYYCMPDGNAASQDVMCPSGKKCFDGACVKSKCSETDAGIDIYKEGTTTTTSGAGEESTDSCATDKIIIEYYCYGDEIRNDHISCPDGFFCDTENDKCMEGSQ